MTFVWRDLLVLWFCLWIEPGSFSMDEEINYRLTDNHIPHNYDLKLILDPAENTFKGQITIRFKTANSTTYVLLHASSSHITNLTKITLNSAHVCEASYSNSKTDILNVTCMVPVQRGENKIYIDYDGVYESSGLENGFLGIFRGFYTMPNGLQYYAATQFQPTYARNLFPCFDEPRFKAVFQISVVHPAKYTVLTNTRMNSSKLNGSTVETKFEKTPPMSTYLLALVVSNLEGTSENSSTPIINVYSQPSQKEHKMTALSSTRYFVEALGNWTGITYEGLGISKLDMVAIPQFTSEAMENWGLIIFQEDDLLDEGNKTSAEDKQNILSLIAHELAHHWFGNYVTLDWWSNTWLNEGFATYLQYIIPDMVGSLKMNLERQMIPLTVQLAFELDDPETGSLSNSYEAVETPSDISAEFSIIAYDKGATIIRMMRGILGEDNFKKGIQSYLKLHAYKNTNPSNLLEALSKFHDDKTINFTDVMKNWIYESGYPIVTASFNKNKNVVKIHQNQFPGNISREEETTWNVPITFTTSMMKNFDIDNIQWLTDKPLEIPMENSSWIILNLQQIGYYRVNYDHELWKRIIVTLKSNEMKQIHVSNRAQLIDDAFALAKVDTLDCNVLMNLASYLEEESEYEPWYAAAKSLRHIRKLLESYGDKDDLQKLRTIVLRWVNTAFPSDKDINWTDHLGILTNQVIFDLKCHMDDHNCLEHSGKILKKFKKTKIVDDHNRRQTALCFGLKTSKTPEEDYRTLLAYYNQSDSAIERKIILLSLGCISDPVVLMNYLSEMLRSNTTILRADFWFVFRGVISNIQGLETTLSFLNNHLKELFERYSDMIEPSDFILVPAQHIVSEQQIDQIKDIMEKYKDIEGMDFDLSFPPINHSKFRKCIKSALANITNL